MNTQDPPGSEPPEKVRLGDSGSGRLGGCPGRPPARPSGSRPLAARHLSQHFAPAVALPRRGVDDNPRDLGPRVRVVVMMVRGSRLPLRLGLRRLRLLRGLLRPLLLRVPAASLAQRLLAHLGAGGRLVGDSPQELHRRLTPGTSSCHLQGADTRPSRPLPSSPRRHRQPTPDVRFHL